VTGASTLAGAGQVSFDGGSAVAQRGGLGKGLGALIPTASVPGGGGLQELPITDVRPNTFQPRQHFDEELLTSLADSVREVGVLQPILVRPLPDGSYELIAGERRWRAARRAGLQTIPALVRDVDDAGALEQALVENLHRSDLNPLEEAAAYQQLIEDFELTHDEVAARVGRSRATVSNTLRLMQLPPAIQRLLQLGQVQMGHARALLGTPDRAFQEQLARRVAGEGLSVREVEDAVRLRNEGVGVARRTTAAPTRVRAPGLLEVEERLGDLFATRVQITMGAKSSGKVIVEFATLEDLERIYRIMNGLGDAPADSPSVSA
jgi:ParB family transcriptional regulator, chromosome partitioning protein